jgi:molybdopterin-guanine dinucleotide biosynthesis protein A
VARQAGEFGAVILAGGRGSRMGGADKPGLVVGAGTIVGSVVRAAIGAGAFRIAVVGPPRPELALIRPGPAGGITFTQEDPPGSGPVAALRCGMAAVGAASPATVALLAGDMPFLGVTELRALLAALGSSAREPAAGAVLTDDAGRPQWLASCWRTRPLAAALAAYRGASLRGLLGPLLPAQVFCKPEAGEPPPWADCDTPDDLRSARMLRHGPASAAQPSPGQARLARRAAQC